MASVIIIPQAQLSPSNLDAYNYVTMGYNHDVEQDYDLVSEVELDFED